MNTLGQYIRTKRNDMGLTLAQASKKMSCSVGYLSRIELGHEEPSPEFLDRIAPVLGIDVLVLLQLQENDRQNTEAPNALSNQQTTPLEQELLHSFRHADERLQRYLVEQSRLSQTLLGRTSPLLPISPSVSNSISGSTAVRSGLIELASTYQNLGEAFLVADQKEASLTAYTNAEAIYTTLEQTADIALTQFRIGRVYRFMTHGPSSSLQTSQHHLLEASRHFQLAYRAFSSVQDMPDDHRGRIPEVLAEWAKVDRDLGSLINTLVTQMMGDFGNYPSDTSIQKRFLAAAKVKREKAATLYSDWISELIERKKSGDESEKQSVNQLLTEAYHRLGAMMMDSAYDADTATDKEFYCSISEEQVRRSLELRRSIVQQETDPANRYMVFERLANGHGFYGWSLQTCNVRDTYADALWQAMVAIKLYEMLPGGKELRIYEEIKVRLITLETEGSSDRDRIVRRRVTERFNTLDFGTYEQPNLTYPLSYPEQVIQNSSEE